MFTVHIAIQPRIDATLEECDVFAAGAYGTQREALIAARAMRVAPQLLAACKAALADLEVISIGHDVQEYDLASDKLLHQLRAAIAKAELATDQMLCRGTSPHSATATALVELAAICAKAKAKGDSP